MYAYAVLQYMALLQHIGSHTVCFLHESQLLLQERTQQKIDMALRLMANKKLDFAHVPTQVSFDY